MNYSKYAFLQKLGNNNNKRQAFKNALVSHGLADDTRAALVVDYLGSKASEEVRNNTESRMTLYTSEINPYLYSDNSFVKKSVNDAQFAASGITKRLNDSSAGPAVTKGRHQSLTLNHGDNAPEKTVKVRRNIGHDWAIEYFHTDPDAISVELTSEIPYEARQETLTAHADVLNQAIANFTAVEWSQGEVGVAETVDTVAETNFFTFTGKGGTDTRLSTVPGNEAVPVKRVTLEDMVALKTRLRKQQVQNKGKIYFLPSVEMYDDLILIPEFRDYDKLGVTSKIQEGIVGNIMGIEILEPRHREDWNANILYSYTALTGDDTDLTKVEDTATAALGMMSAGIAWVESLVLRAEGSAIVFPWMNSPTYLADVYASEVRYSAKKKRADSKGVVMLVENPFIA